MNSKEDALEIFKKLAIGGLTEDEASQQLAILIKQSEQKNKINVPEKIEALRQDTTLSLKEKLLNFFCYLLQDVTKSSNINAESKWVELGLDSLMITSVMSQVNRHIGISIPPTLLFEFSTVGEVVEFLESRYSEAIANLFDEKARQKTKDEFDEMHYALPAQKVDSDFSSLWDMAEKDEALASWDRVLLNIGGTIEVFSKGNGAPLVVLGGFGGSFDGLREFCEKFTDAFKVVYISYPGHGGSDFFDEQQMNITNFVSLVVDCMKQVAQEEPFSIIGYSMGGVIAQAICRSHPDKVKKLVLIATTCMNTITENFMQKMIAEVARVKSNAILNSFSVPTESLINAYNNFFSSVIELKMETMTVNSTLIVQGEQDELVGEMEMSRLASYFPSADYQVLSRAGHFLVWTHENEACYLVREFLNQS